MWTFLVLLTSLVQWTFSEQHILLDSTKESMLDWTKYPHGPQAPTPGWVEESFTNFEKGINWRSYVVCDVGYPNVNNWLWTPFIERGQANRIHIEIKFSLRNCDLFPGTALQCKETFTLLFYEFDAATREPPPWEPDSYKLIDRIAADEGRFTNNNEVIINTETRSVDVNKKGVYFAFRDQGACLSLLAIKVYYKTCPEITKSFAFFPETPTGKTESAIEKIPGQCVSNSVQLNDHPFSFCKSDGTWLYNQGGCQCMAGYEADRISGPSSSCRECPVGKFKASPGESFCTICPPHSEALFSGSVECRCNKGYYRAKEDDRSSACTRPPSAPRNLSLTSVDPNKVTLSWQAPRDEGSRQDTVYRVSCDLCGSGVTYSPTTPTFPQTFVSISGLSPLTTYRFTVFAMNGVSSMARGNPPKNADITVNTETDNNPSTITVMFVKNVQATSITVGWQPPSEGDEIEIEMYEVRYSVKGSKAGKNKNATLITIKEELEVTGLAEKTEYGFQVRAKTSQGWGEWTPPVYRATTAVDGPIYMPDNTVTATTPAIVGAVVAVIVLLLLIAVFVTLYLRRNADDWAKKQVGDCDTLEYRGVSPHYTAESGAGIIHTHTAGNMPLFNTFATHKTYVDPHTYEDPHQAVRQFAKEIDSRYITIEAIIGGGEFGDVCRGRLSLPDRQDMLVAIKTLKPGSSDKARSDFLTEASIMGQFEHPNVIFLQGVVTRANPVMIITEYMENGSLDTFLRANDGKFQVMQLVGMMRGIAYGMQYLAEMNYVHRDLAARNVLVNSQLVCKIADFGLSREITESNVDGAYTTRGGKIPVRWTAPEAIAFRKFTSSSDAWSFGIVMWEVMSYGERPYWNWSNQDVIKAIEKGYRLPAPMDCPEAIHQLMLDCWQKERAHRPAFTSIVKTLDKLICCPETLRKIASSQASNPLAPDAPDLTQFNSVDEWLTSIKMTRYSDNFAAAGIVTMDQVARLGLSQLVELGVTLVGHQKKIMNSVQAMRAQISVNVSEGFLV
jgi:Eph receptor B1